MKDGLITLADLPALEGSDPSPRSTITIGRLDSNLTDPRYGKFSITQSDVDSWKRNLAGVFGGQVAFDFDHSSDRGGGTKAALWVNDIHQTGTEDGSLITADVQFSAAGATAVRNREYKYTSPTFVADYTDEHGVKHGKALIGGALTNRPVLRKGMPTLSLSRDEFPELDLDPEAERERARELHREISADERDGKTEPARDSRRPVDLKALAQKLDLPEDTDEAALLAKVDELKTLATPSPGDAGKEETAEPTTLAEPGSDGTITLSADQVAELITNANAGAAAAKQLSEQTFAHAWQKALSEGRAAPSQEETVKALFDQSPELAIKTLDSFVPIVPVTPKGSGEGAGSGPAPLGMDDERFALHTEAKQLAAQKTAANPSLDPGEAYILAAQEIEDRKFTLEHPGI